MPVITIETGPLNLDQKRILVATLAKNSAEIMEVPEHAFIVLVKENDPSNIGVGATLLADREKIRGGLSG